MKRKIVSRRVVVYLDEGTAKMLDRLSKKLGFESVSELVRFAIRFLYKEVELTEKVDRRITRMIEG